MTNTTTQPYTKTWRDVIASKLANLMLQIATPEYRKLVAGAIEYGLSSAARDLTQGRDAPGDWRDPNVRENWTHGKTS